MMGTQPARWLTALLLFGAATAGHAATVTVTVRGTVTDPAAAIEVNGIAATVQGNVFVAEVPLAFGTNTITVTATDAQARSNQQTITVYVHSPSDGPAPFVLCKVTGTVSQAGVQAIVNGVAASMTGSAFTAHVPLAGGAGQVTVTATDAAGQIGVQSADVFVVRRPVEHP